MYTRNENSPSQLTGWHFEQAINYLKNSNYKNLYDASANLTAVANLIDLKSITPYPIHFINPVSPESSRHTYKSINAISLETDDERIGDEKLPSYEAMQAYAQCTNNPVNDDEEILLRTIDLLIAMGQRCNEITYIPYDCWVEYPQKDDKGNVLIDSNQKPIMNFGIRYYAEKEYQSTTHWLAEQDVPFAKRAIDRLRILTKEAREIAKWQENNSGKLWKYDKDEIISDLQVMEYLGFANTYNLYLYLKQRNGISEVRSDKKIRRPMYSNRTFNACYYRAGDIEDFLLSQGNDHNAYKEKYGNGWKTILKTSDVLSIRFEGAFRFKRAANTFKIFPGITNILEINGAFGAIPDIESIFKRRNLTEANGEPITLTSHQSRHWRNTLYQLAGMSNINQAIAMGRKNINQNIHYQHLTLQEQTQAHKDFLTFNTVSEKINFLHDGIKNKSILGSITTMYHSIKETKGEATAQDFLNVYGTALHITPFGGCMHDFSQAPCPKYLQCWNGCSHLHLTGTAEEKENLKNQLALSRTALKQMKQESDGEYGADKWTMDLEQKIKNLGAVLSLSKDDNKHYTQAFPNGKQYTVALENKKGSII